MCPTAVKLQLMSIGVEIFSRRVSLEYPAEEQFIEEIPKVNLKFIIFIVLFDFSSLRGFSSLNPVKLLKVL